MKNLSGKELARVLERHGWRLLRAREVITSTERKEASSACRCQIGGKSPCADPTVLPKSVTARSTQRLKLLSGWNHILDWRCRVSNPGRYGYEPYALPPELHRHGTFDI